VNFVLVNKIIKMKLLQFSFALSLAGVTVACAGVTEGQKATVTRDCTGTYLRVEGKDYLVCNAAILKNHKEGATVTAKFAKTESCPEFDGQVVCMMYHENKGTIRISEVK
jgi:acyl-coenzyme A thioesterase PaaI-like protein